MNLPGFPVARPRRLRTSPALRRLVAETQLNVAQLVLPLFARRGKKLRHPVDAMPGVFQLSPDEILREATKAHELGIPAVLLFGIPARRRRWLSLLGMAVLLVALTGGVLACGGGGGGGGGCTPVAYPGTTAGAYAITVTGTSGATTATGTVTLTVQ